VSWLAQQLPQHLTNSPYLDWYLRFSGGRCCPSSQIWHPQVEGISCGSLHRNGTISLHSYHPFGQAIWTRTISSAVWVILVFAGGLVLRFGRHSLHCKCPFDSSLLSCDIDILPARNEFRSAGGLEHLMSGAAPTRCSMYQFFSEWPRISRA
jgi:hypothetical protein